MNAYKLYSQDFIPCVYCNKLVSLYNATAHLKTKSCKTIQQLMEEKERTCNASKRGEWLTTMHSSCNDPILSCGARSGSSGRT